MDPFARRAGAAEEDWRGFCIIEIIAVDETVFFVSVIWGD